MRGRTQCRSLPLLRERERVIERGVEMKSITFLGLTGRGFEKKRESVCVCVRQTSNSEIAHLAFGPPSLWQT